MFSNIVSNAAKIGAGVLFASAALGMTMNAAQAQSGYISGANKLEVWVTDSLGTTEYLNQFDLMYSNENWLVGARLEMDEETRWDDTKETELVRRYAEYNDETLTLRGGHFYATFGRGLLLRAMEDDDVRIDRDIDGIHGQAVWKQLDGQGFIGRPRNDDSKERDHLLSGADLSVQATEQFTLGGGYVRVDADGDDLDEDIAGRPIEELAGGRMAFIHGDLDFYLEGAKRMRLGELDRRGNWVGTTEEDGRAWYGTMNLSLPGYAFLVEYKNYYDFDFAYSTPPPCNRDGAPLTNGIDEKGLGFVATISPNDNLTLDANASFADTYDRLEERTAGGLSFRREWWGKGTLMLGGEYVEEIEMVLTTGYAYRKWVGPAFEGSYYLSEDLTVQLKGHIYDRSDTKIGAEEYTEFETDLTLTHSSAKSVTLNVIKSSVPLHSYANDDTWINLALTMTLGHKHELTLKIGEERGGITCSGGICRYEDPFKGIRLELTSRL